MESNAIMNHMLGGAIDWAISNGHLKRPRVYEQYIAFTDDLVMGTVFDKCSDAPKVRGTPFGRILTRSSIPRHLGFVLLEETDEVGRSTRIEALRAQKRAEVGGDVLAVEADSDLSKGIPPTLRFWKKHANKPTLEPFMNRSSILQNQEFRTSYRVIHFFQNVQEN